MISIHLRTCRPNDLSPPLAFPRFPILPNSCHMTVNLEENYYEHNPKII
jgi:hypothetical protein